MLETVKKNQRGLIISLIILCMGIILTGGVLYLKTLQNVLQENAVQNVISATTQQRQSFDDFLAVDQERLHS